MILGGVTRKIDYGMINEKVIVSTMTIGILADTAAPDQSRRQTKIR